MVLFEEARPGLGYYIVTRPGVLRPPLKAFVAWLRRHAAARPAAAARHRLKAFAIPAPIGVACRPQAPGSQPVRDPGQPPIRRRSSPPASRSSRAASTAASARSSGGSWRVTLGIYYVTPWIRWDRGPALPDQAVLVDLANRRFYFFFIEIWPQEFYFVAGLLIMAGLGLFLFTSALGRVWCGYTCPQTVWTDLFILVERWIEGDRNARVRLWNAPWTRRQGPPARGQVDRLAADRRRHRRRLGLLLRRRADALARAPDLQRAAGRLHRRSRILTATTFIFGGFMREQVCIYMCPWPRIQAAMMDEETLTVAYRDWRGEPRAQAPPRRARRRRGPSRRRLHRLQRLRQRLPDGHRHPRRPAARLHHLRALHRRLRRRDGQGRQAARPDRLRHPRRRRARARRRRRRCRSGAASCGRGCSSTPCSGPASASRWSPRSCCAPTCRSSVEPVRNPINVTLSDGSIRNAYELRLRNMTGYDRDFRLSAAAEAPLALELQGLPGLDASPCPPTRRCASAST